MPACAGIGVFQTEIRTLTTLSDRYAAVTIVLSQKSTKDRDVGRMLDRLPTRCPERLPVGRNDLCLPVRIQVPVKTLRSPLSARERQFGLRHRHCRTRRYSFRSYVCGLTGFWPACSRWDYSIIRGDLTKNLSRVKLFSPRQATVRETPPRSSLTACSQPGRRNFLSGHVAF